MKLAAGTSFVFALTVLVGGFLEYYLYASRAGSIIAVLIAGVMLYLTREIAACKLPAMYVASAATLTSSVIYAARLVAFGNLVVAAIMVLSFCALFLILLGFFLRLKEMGE